MYPSFRHTMIATAAILGLSTVGAIAAPNGAGDPTATHGTSAATRPALATAVEQRINDLHAKLQITAAQETQWSAFAQVMRDNAKNMDDTFDTRAKSIATMTAAENMKSYATISMQHAKDMQNLAPAFETLYGAMSDSQKRTADQVFRDNAGQPRHG
jgi:protein CpxP